MIFFASLASAPSSLLPSFSPALSLPCASLAVPLLSPLSAVALPFALLVFRALPPLFSLPAAFPCFSFSFLSFSLPVLVTLSFMLSLAIMSRVFLQFIVRALCPSCGFALSLLIFCPCPPFFPVSLLISSAPASFISLSTLAASPALRLLILSGSSLVSAPFPSPLLCPSFPLLACSLSSVQSPPVSTPLLSLLCPTFFAFPLVTHFPPLLAVPHSRVTRVRLFSSSPSGLLSSAPLIMTPTLLTFSSPRHLPSLGVVAFLLLMMLSPFSHTHHRVFTTLWLESRVVLLLGLRRLPLDCARLWCMPPMSMLRLWLVFAHSLTPYWVMAWSSISIFLTAPRGRDFIALTFLLRDFRVSLTARSASAKAVTTSVTWCVYRLTC